MSKKQDDSKFKIYYKHSKQTSSGIKFNREDSWGTDYFGKKFTQWYLVSIADGRELRIVCNNNRGTCIVGVRTADYRKDYDINGVTGIVFKDEKSALKAIENNTRSKILKSFK